MHDVDQPLCNIPWHRLERCVAQTPCDPVSLDWLEKAGVQAWVHRADELLPEVAGNKLYKLFGNLWLAKAEKTGVVSLGGAWSNHLHALAQACSVLNIPVAALVRQWGSGENADKTATLLDCEKAGMDLRSISRGEYRELRHMSAGDVFGCYGFSENNVFVPEGGSSLAGLLGCYHWGKGLAGEVISKQLEDVWVACGTGATLAGLMCGLSAELKARGFPKDQLPKVVGVAALKTLRDGESFLQRDIQGQIEKLQRFLPTLKTLPFVDWQLVSDGYDRGFGQASPELLEFMQETEGQLRFQLEPVYTAKVLFALSHSVAQNKHSGKRILVVHTGGLQGRRGWPELQMADQVMPGLTKAGQATSGQNVTLGCSANKSSIFTELYSDEYVDVDNGEWT
ncbi:MAG: pyridoxal-phosphate dependent enzyme [Cellvibrionaceae bacterium]